MKNLKKFNRANLKEVFGGVFIPQCPTSYSYLIPYNGYYACCRARTDNPCQAMCIIHIDMCATPIEEDPI
ncbi:bacteriocin-like protein [Chryseobacterium antibioticum]